MVTLGAHLSPSVKVQSSRSMVCSFRIFEVGTGRRQRSLGHPREDRLLHPGFELPAAEGLG